MPLPFTDHYFYGLTENKNAHLLTLQVTGSLGFSGTGYLI